MTTRFFKAGIRNEHLTGIGTAIETACRRSLDTAWNDQYKEAWAWIWKLVEQAMRRTLNVLEQDHAQKVRESWEKCKNKMETVELGESIFKELASIAPYLVHLFKRPKRIQAAQFVSAIDLLVCQPDPAHPGRSRALASAWLCMWVAYASRRVHR